MENDIIENTAQNQPDNPHRPQTRSGARSRIILLSVVAVVVVVALVFFILSYGPVSANPAVVQQANSAGHGVQPLSSILNSSSQSSSPPPPPT